MKHIRAYLYIIGVTLMVAVMAACSVSYKFNGASIDYTKTKTIQIADFLSEVHVWGPMGPMFNNELRDKFASNTQLIQVSRNGDLKIEAEITQYSQRNKSVGSEGYSSSDRAQHHRKRAFHQHQEPYRGLPKSSLHLPRPTTPLRALPRCRKNW